MTTYRSVVAERNGDVYTTAGALAHLLGHDADDEACEDCPASVQVVTGSAMPTGGFLDERLPGTYAATDVLVEHDDLDALEVSEATERIKQCERIADALNAAEAAPPETPAADRP